MSRETTCQVRVRYQETDAMGVVYYANYLTWFEVGRCDLLRHLGDSYHEIEERDGIHLPVLEAHCRYLRPARYDDVVEIRTRASLPSRARLRFDYHLWKGSTLLATGSTVHAAVTRGGRPCRLPPQLTEILE